MDYKEIKHGPLKIRISQDDDAPSPREGDNCGVMVCWHCRYDLGDKHEFKTPDDFKAWMVENDGLPGLFVILPVYLLDHSGLYLRTSSFSDVDPGRWDSGQVGWIYMPPERAKKEFQDDKEKILSCLQSEVETYGQYLQGEVFCWEIWDSMQCWDSCGGHYNYDECVTVAKETADAIIKQGPYIENVVNHIENVMGFLDDLQKLLGGHREGPLDRVHAWLSTAQQQATEMRDDLLEEAEEPTPECGDSPVASTKWTAAACRSLTGE